MKDDDSFEEDEEEDLIDEEDDAIAQLLAAPNPQKDVSIKISDRERAWALEIKQAVEIRKSYRTCVLWSTHTMQ